MAGNLFLQRLFDKGLSVLASWVQETFLACQWNALVLEWLDSFLGCADLGCIVRHFYHLSL